MSYIKCTQRWPGIIPASVNVLVRGKGVKLIKGGEITGVLSQRHVSGPRMLLGFVGQRQASSTSTGFKAKATSL